MPIDVEKYRTILKELEGELLASLEKSEVDARETASAEVEDQIDQANTDMSKDLVLDEESRDYDKLRMVREALERAGRGDVRACAWTAGGRFRKRVCRPCRGRRIAWKIRRSANRSSLRRRFKRGGSGPEVRAQPSLEQA